MANSNKYDVGFDKELVGKRNSNFFQPGIIKGNTEILQHFFSKNERLAIF